MKKPDCKLDEMFFGSVTVGDRGQIVIPAEARQQLNIQAGDKLLVMRQPGKDGLMIFKIDEVMEFIQMMQQVQERVQQAITDDAKHQEAKE